MIYLLKHKPPHKGPHGNRVCIWMCYPQIRDNIHPSLKPFRRAKGSEKVAGEGSHLLTCKNLACVNQHHSPAEQGAVQSTGPGKACKPASSPSKSHLPSRQHRPQLEMWCGTWLPSCSCRGPGLDSQHQHGGSKPPTIGPRESSDLLRPRRTPDIQAHRHTCIKH